MPKRLIVGAVLAASLAAAGGAHAGKNDIVLARLGEVDDPVDPTDVVGSNLLFRSLASELGVVLAPRLLTPSDTLGFGGFQFSADLAFTSIDATASYWRVLESSPDPVGAQSHGEGLMPSFGMFVRKGLWLPVPSCEVGLGAVHLMDSKMWAAQGYVKLALHEGYHDLPIPSVAVRGASSRMMGSEQIDLTIASFDLSVAKDFGLQGTVAVSPYAGWNRLWIVPRSEVIDKTPQFDLFDRAGDANLNFVFKDQDTISRNKFFAGVKLQYYVFELTFEAAIATAGSSVDDRTGTDDDCADVNAGGTVTTRCDSTDQSSAQETYTFAFGLDF